MLDRDTIIVRLPATADLPEGESVMSMREMQCLRTPIQFEDPEPRSRETVLTALEQLGWMVEDANDH